MRSNRNYSQAAQRIAADRNRPQRQRARQVHSDLRCHVVAVHWRVEQLPTRKEARNFNRLLSEKEDVRKKCSHFPSSPRFLMWLSLASPSTPGTKAQAYLLARSIAVDSYVDDHGQKKNRYETQCVLTVSGYGGWCFALVAVRYAMPTTLSSSMREDSFEFGERNGRSSSITPAVSLTSPGVSWLVS